MNRHVSIGMPVAPLMRAIGSMSLTAVRAAQFGRIRSRSPAMARHSASTSSAARGPAPGRPTSAVSIPRASMARRMRTLVSIGGSVTLGPCSPSRSVSSSSMTGPRGTGAGPTWFQS
jgi:hypothetical protein